MSTEHYIRKAVAADGTPVYELWSHAEFMNWEMGIEHHDNRLAVNADRAVLEEALKHLTVHDSGTEHTK